MTQSARPVLDLSQTCARPSKCTPEPCSTTTPIYIGVGLAVGEQGVKMTAKTARPRKPYQSKRQKPKSDPRNTVTPEFMKHDAWRNEADQILAQVDQVVNDIETK